MASSKYIITPDKFSLDTKNRLIFKIDCSSGIPCTFNQNLQALSRDDLNTLANITGIATCRKWKKTLIKELTDKIEFQVPEELIEYENDYILDKYADFPQINIPLSNQGGNAFYYEFKKFYYEFKNLSSADDVVTLWYNYPFNKQIPKSSLVLLCEEIKIMTHAEACNRSKNELIELLNDKFVLEG